MCYHRLRHEVRAGKFTKDELIDSGLWTPTISELLDRKLTKARERRTIEADLARRSMRDNPHNDK